VIARAALKWIYLPYLVRQSVPRKKEAREKSKRNGIELRYVGMNRLRPFVLVAAFVLSTSSVAGQDPDTRQVAQERKEATRGPKLADTLGLSPGMTVADVGAGFGAMTVVLAKSLTSGLECQRIATAMVFLLTS
jgi:hypothetical protein